MFSMKDGNGRPINDLSAHIMKEARKEIEKHLVSEIKALTADLKCKTHNQGVTSISVRPNGKDYTATFGCCCPELEQLAQKAFQAA